MDRALLSKLLSFNVVAGALGWSYATTFAQMAQRWSDTPEYSHGWLILGFSLWLIWSNLPPASRRGFTLTNIIGGAAVANGLYHASLHPSHADWTPALPAVLVCCGVGTLLAGWLELPPAHAWLWGGGLLLGGVLFRLGSTYYYYEWFDELSLIPVLWGLAHLFFGPTLPRGMLPAILFLVFMVPLPFTLEHALREPLRSLATNLSALILQTLGFPTMTEGHVILIGESRVGVAEACSGLSMLMVFAALTAGAVLVIKRPWWYLTILALSCPAIAIIANVFRIVLVSALHAWGYDHLGEITYHDLVGLTMMPVGLLLLWGEMLYLDALFLLEEERRVSPFLMELPATTDRVVAT